jgi:hypothetical protein
MRTVNSAGYVFVWSDGSPYIEVFRKEDPDWSPFEVVWAGNLEYGPSALNTIAHSSREYSYA